MTPVIQIIIVKVKRSDLNTLFQKICHLKENDKSEHAGTCFCEAPTG